jgi:hypothetical protein
VFEFPEHRGRSCYGWSKAQEEKGRLIPVSVEGGCLFIVIDGVQKVHAFTRTRTLLRLRNPGIHGGWGIPARKGRGCDAVARCGKFPGCRSLISRSGAFTFLGGPAILRGDAFRRFHHRVDVLDGAAGRDVASILDDQPAEVPELFDHPNCGVAHLFRRP